MSIPIGKALIVIVVDYLVFFGLLCKFGFFSDVAELSKAFPTVDMVFENKQKFRLAPENYLFRVSTCKRILILITMFLDFSILKFYIICW